MSGTSSGALRLRSPRGSLDVEHQQGKQAVASPKGRQQGPPPDAAAADAGEPAPPKGLRRLGSKLWGSESSLLRHSSITVFELTGERWPAVLGQACHTVNAWAATTGMALQGVGC